MWWNVVEINDASRVMTWIFKIAGRVGSAFRRVEVGRVQEKWTVVFTLYLFAVTAYCISPAKWRGQVNIALCPISNINVVYNDWLCKMIRFTKPSKEKEKSFEIPVTVTCMCFKVVHGSDGPARLVGLGHDFAGLFAGLLVGWVGSGQLFRIF